MIKVLRHYFLFLVVMCFVSFPIKGNGQNENNTVKYIVKNRTQLKQLSQQEGDGLVCVIRSNIDLNNETIELPKGCSLVFERGKIKNGTLFFRDAKLGGKVRIQCNFTGTLQNEVIYTEWFMKGTRTKKRVVDESKKVQAIFDLGAKKVVFGSGYYQFTHLNVGRNVDIVGNGTIIKTVVLEQDQYNFSFLKNVFYAKDAEIISITGLEFRGSSSGTFLPSFSSNSIYGEPLIWVDKAQKVVVRDCIFKDIENCTYCNSDYTYYGKKQGSCVCLWDVSDATYENCEQVNCRHDEQVWIIAVNKPIMETQVTYRGNYIHDMTPGPNSSAFTCVAGSCFVENNKVERYNYPGSLFNTFAKRLKICNNHIADSYCSSVFDACEYSFFHNDEIVIENNEVEAVNSVMVLGQSEKAIIKNNTFQGLGLYYSTNNRVSSRSVGRYKYWYSSDGVILPVDSETIIEGNVADFTHYDGQRSIAGTIADYGTGKIIEPQKYNNVGANYGCGILIHPLEAKAGNISIINNCFTSIESLDGVKDENNLKGIYPQAIRLMNTENCTIKGNIFNGAYPTFQSPDTYSCISIYNYPDVMESLENPEALSAKPSQYGKYIIEDNTFNVKADSFVVVTVNPRKNQANRPPMIIDEITIKGNSVPSTVKKITPFITDAPIRMVKETIE